MRYTGKVVSTSDRHSARYQLLVMFGKQLDRFAVRTHNVAAVISWLSNFLGVSLPHDASAAELLEVHAEAEEELTSFRHNIRLKTHTLLLTMALLFVVYMYLDFRFYSG